MRRGAGPVVLRLEPLSQSRYLSDRHVPQHLEGAFRDGSGPGQGRCRPKPRHLGSRIDDGTLEIVHQPPVLRPLLPQLGNGQTVHVHHEQDFQLHYQCASKPDTLPHPTR